MAGHHLVFDGTALGAVVITDKRMERAEHKAFVASEIAKLQPVIDAAGKFAD